MKKILSILTPVQWLAVALIIIGIGIMIPKAMGMFEFYKEANYAAEHDFAAGNLSPDLIRPWMSLRYIAAAYAVPQQYIYNASGITPRRETSMIALDRLNQQMRLGQVDGQPALLITVKEAILAYRANPVVTGLLERQVEEWMTLLYIANSTGIPVETMCSALNIVVDGNTNKPIGFLSSQLNYPGGQKALVQAIQSIVSAHTVSPVKP